MSLDGNPAAPLKTSRLQDRESKPSPRRFKVFIGLPPAPASVPACRGAADRAPPQRRAAVQRRVRQRGGTPSDARSRASRRKLGHPARSHFGSLTLSGGGPQMPVSDRWPTWRNWQTRQTQNLVLERVCGFNPLRRHQRTPAPVNGERYDSFTVSYYANGKRQRRRFAGLSGISRQEGQRPDATRHRGSEARHETPA